MVSLRHRLFELMVRRQSMPDPRDLEHLREMLAAEQAQVTLTPPDELTATFEVAAVDGFGADSDCPAYAVAQPGRQPERTVFYLHGGGYVGHATEQHWRFAGRLAEAATARVVVVQYPIAPAHTWRDAHAAVLEVYRKVAAEVDHELTLLGDSAGGGLALALTQRLVAAGEPLPAKLVVYTPWGDLALDLSQPEHDPWMSKPYLAMAGQLWAGGDPTDLPELSPLFGDFTGLPPLLVVCGTKDLSLPQARAIVGKARAAGVPTTYIEGRGLLHDYPVLNLPEGRKAIRQTAEFLRNS